MVYFPGAFHVGALVCNCVLIAGLVQALSWLDSVGEPAAHAVEGFPNGIRETAERCNRAKSDQGRNQRVLDQILSRILCDQLLEKLLCIFHFPLPFLSVFFSKRTACECDDIRRSKEVSQSDVGPIGQIAAYVRVDVVRSHKLCPS